MAAAPAQRKILVLIVHGVGEQLRFEQLESVVANLYKALAYAGRRPAIEVHHADQAPRGSPQNSLREQAVTLRWEAPGKHRRPTRIEARFREIHWADLDEPLNFAGWWKFVGWAVSMCGVRFFDVGRVGPPSRHGMRAPKTLSRWRQAGVRVKLFILSLVFLILLGTVGLLDVVLKRFSITIKALERGYRLFFDYLGDIKLYQDWYARADGRAEVVGAKSRVAVRRRMVCGLVQTASEALGDPSIDGYYIFAHSLGTVVAFNALMETEVALPNYLTQDEWDGAHPRLKKAVAECPDYQSPSRRPWLDPYRGGYAAIDRDALQEKCLGFLTVGSPLDRFAALWPAIVPIANQSPRRAVEWVNVHDVQDLVAGGTIKLFEPRNRTIGGLTKAHDISWADQFWFFRAHTSYWDAKKNSRRLIDAVYRWLEGSAFELEPGGRVRVALSRALHATWLLAVAGLLVWMFAALIRLAVKAVRPLLERYEILWPVRDFLIEQQVLGHYGEAIVPIMLKSLLAGAVLIAICSLCRHFWERHKFRR